MIRFAEPASNFVDTHLPAKWKNVLLHYSSGSQTMNHESLWKKFILALTRITIEMCIRDRRYAGKLSFFCYKPFHSFRIVRLKFSIPIRINEARINIRMLKNPLFPYLVITSHILSSKDTIPQVQKKENKMFIKN